MNSKTINRRNFISYSVASLITFSSLNPAQTIFGKEQIQNSNKQSRNILTSQLGSAFSYQGFLRRENIPANGVMDIKFSLFDSQENGNQIGDTITQPVSVNEGQFSTSLDFGPNIFFDEKRFLELQVRRRQDSYQTLSPRQELLPVPQSYYSVTSNSLSSTDGEHPKVVFVNEAGNVGINTENPGQKLHLGDGNFLIEGGGETAIPFKRDFTTPDGPSGPSVNPIFSWGRIIEAGDGDPEIRLLYQDDNTGEGTVFEIDRKGIAASVKQDVGSHFEGFISRTDPEPIFRLNSYPKMRLEMGEGGNTAVDVAIQREDTNTLTLLTNNTEGLRIDGSGNVGIGTQAPLERLHIKDGNIRIENGGLITDATNLVISSQMDQLNSTKMPLADLKSYIEGKNQLPQLPNSADLQENGLNFVQFQITLLRKIEELTLYIIENHQQINNIQDSIQA